MKTTFNQSLRDKTPTAWVYVTNICSRVQNRNILHAIRSAVVGQDTERARAYVLMQLAPRN